jgi:CheY-like chemotaxis protein
MPCVLIVDDDAEVREFMDLLLSMSGYETMTAWNGREGLEKMHARRPCVVLLDVMMPVMDGWEFRRRQLNDPKDARVPVVAVTAHNNPGEVSRSMGVRCLPKPVDIDEVLSEVERACGGPPE